MTQNQKLIWDGLIKVGEIMKDFYCGKYNCNNGYVAKRLIKDQQREIECLCRVFSSTTHIPMLECIATEGNVEIGRSVSMNATSAAKKIIDISRVKISIRSGSSFFGLDRPEVMKLGTILIIIMWIKRKYK